MIKMMLRDWLIRATFFEVLFLSMSTPQTKVLIMQAINPQLFAVRFLVGNISIILFMLIYEKYSHVMYKYFPIMMGFRLLSSSIVIIMVIFNQMTLVTYFVCDLIIASLLSKSVSCCRARMKRFMHNGQKRENFDNYKHCGAAIAGIIGNTIALIGIPTIVAWVFMLLAVIVDVVCSTIQYYELKRKYS